MNTKLILKHNFNSGLNSLNNIQKNLHKIKRKFIIINPKHVPLINNNNNNSKNNCKYPISELIFAVLIKNTSNFVNINNINDIFKYSSSINIDNINGYYNDSKTKKSIELINKIKDDKYNIINNSEILLLLKNKKIDVYLTGKSYKKYDAIINLNKSILDNKYNKHTKSDIYINILNDNLWLGISIKENEKCQLSNWSIETSIIKDKELGVQFKQIRENILKNNGILKKWK